MLEQSLDGPHRIRESFAQKPGYGSVEVCGHFQIILFDLSQPVSRQVVNLAFPGSDDRRSRPRPSTDAQLADNTSHAQGAQPYLLAVPDFTLIS